MIAIVLIAGVVIGLTLGALGGGGSILTVPALVYLLGMDAHQATTASLIIVGTTSLFAMIPHARRGHLSVSGGLTFGVLGVAGSLLGARAAALVPAPVLLGGFSVLMLVVAVLMLRRRDADGSGTESGGGTAKLITLRPFRCSVSRVLKLLITATAVGLLTGFFGVGGGFAVVPALVLALGFRMPVAVGTSLLVIAINSATALAGRLGTGISLDWAVVGLFSAVAVLASLVAGSFSARLPARTLSRGFAVMLILVALAMGVQTALGAR